jgi:hypothetical protein
MTGIGSVACPGDLIARASPGLPSLLLALVVVSVGKLARAVPGRCTG